MRLTVRQSKRTGAALSLAGLVAAQQVETIEHAHNRVNEKTSALPEFRLDDMQGVSLFVGFFSVTCREFFVSVTYLKGARY